MADRKRNDRKRNDRKRDNGKRDNGERGKREPSARARSGRGGDGRGRRERGRGAGFDPANRFLRLHVVPDSERTSDDPAPRTRFFRDSSRTIVANNGSPDVGFESSLNPYRGCEHGCAYCYARPGHEYLGLSAGLDFESKIFVKEEAPALLRRALSSPRWRPRTLVMSGVTDPYQPIEQRLGLTRRCLEVLAEFRNPVAIITKNHGVTRDVDLLSELAAVDAVTVIVSVTTLRRELQGALEPRTSTPTRRLEAIAKLAEVGVPVRVNVAPVIPGLTDHEMPSILEECAAAGATGAGWIMLRLPGAVAPLFEDWLERHVPERKEKVLNRLREMRGGRLNDPRFGTRMRGEGVYAEQIARVFEVTTRRLGLNRAYPALSTGAFRRPEPAGPAADQLGLFG